jgi:cytidine deaminase
MTETTDRQLVARALAARKSAYSRYSGFKVGAALIDETGHVHIGCNVENAAYPEGSCAETGAIAAMVVAGGRQIRTIAVAGGAAEPGDCTPCGACRQRITEFASADTRVLVVTGDDKWQSFTIADLLPASFHLD